MKNTEEDFMTYKEVGFRAFYHQFCALMLEKKLAASVKDFPGADEADCFLTYGYIDQTAGLTLEILACGKKEGNSFRFFDTASDVRSFIRIGAVAEEEFFYFGDEDGDLAKRYTEKIAVLHHYDAPEEVEKSREMSFLDECRDDNCVDDVLVYLIKDNLKPEGCWTRIIGLGEHWFIGTLLNEPNQNFGYHQGEKIAFYAQKTDDGKFVCYTDMNPSAKITEEDLADGKMLEAAVTRFNSERNEPNFLDVLEILRDSYVWVPCNAIMSEADQARLEALVKEKDLDSLVGVDFVAHDETRLVPDILQNGEAFFFPIFSNAEAMGEYGNHFSKVQKHMLEVIPLARNNERELAGIVLNAFTEPFVLDQKVWDVVENMKSRIQN